MTNFEKAQPARQFIEAGRKSFKIGVNIQDNPYRDNPWKGLWFKGYSAEKRKNQERRK